MINLRNMIFSNPDYHLIRKIKIRTVAEGAKKRPYTVRTYHSRQGKYDFFFSFFLPDKNNHYLCPVKNKSVYMNTFITSLTGCPSEGVSRDALRRTGDVKYAFTPPPPHTHTFINK
jgi:hypothetical protein